MKARNMKKVLLIFSVCILFLLAFYNIKLVKKEKAQEKTISHNNKEKNVVHIRKTYDYSDMLYVLDKCSSKFLLNKINKTESSSNKINVEITYEGEIEGLLDGVNQLKNQEIVDSINEINMHRKEDGKCAAEIMINFYKVK